MTNAYKHLTLVDGSGYIFRAFFGTPPMRRPDGTPVNAVFGFTNMLKRLKAESSGGGLAVIFDAGRESFRTALYPDYKGHRPEAPEDLIPQFPLIRDATEAMNLPAVELVGYEADDLIATYSRQATEYGIAVTIVSSDKDLMQLVGEGVALFDPMKNTPIGHAEVEKKFGVPPEQVIDVQALAGDSSDNIPGVPGVGIKTAAQLIRDYGSLDQLLDRAQEIKQPKRRQNLIDYADQARLSRQLVTLDQRVPVEVPLEAFVHRTDDPAKLRPFLEKNGFRSILARLPDDSDDCDEETTAPKYELIQDDSALLRWIAEAQACGQVAVDTETTSLNVRTAELVGVSLSCGGNRACYIPLAHRSSDAGLLNIETGPKQIPQAQAIDRLKPLLEDPSVLKIGQNIKYDALILAHHGIELAPFDDTMLLSYVVEGGQGGHGMDDLAQRHLQHRCIAFKDVCGTGKKQITFDRVPLEQACEYAAEDALVTWRLHEVLKPMMMRDRLNSVYETLERPLVPVLAQMEKTGIRVDRGLLRRLSHDFSVRLAHLEGDIHRLAGESFNINSPKQLGQILFDRMGLPGGKKSKKSGDWATGAEVLDKLAAAGHDFPARVLEWRQLSKLKSTYSDALQDQIDPDSGRVHTSYSQAVTTTGRLSSSDPNLQNIPIRTEDGRKIRDVFIAKDGATLLSADYSQVELRLVAHIAREEALCRAFAEGQDIHAITAHQVFGVPLADMDPMVRRQAKAINFGIIYGQSAFGLAQSLGISNTEAKDYIAAYFARFPGIRRYMDEITVTAREQGYVETLFGRRIFIPAITEKNPMRRNFGERAAINAPIQGTAADIIKRAMIRMPDALRRAGLGADLLLQVHDELVFEVPDDQISDTIEVVCKVMETAPDPVLKLSVPLMAEAGTGKSWGDAH